MAKKFTDSTKWERQWFRELPPEYKCFWFYILDRCNCGGIWDIDYSLASFNIGAQIEEDKVFSLFEGKIKKIDGHEKILICEYVLFQLKYNVDELNPKSQFHKAVIDIHEKYGLIKSKSKHKEEPKPKVADHPLAFEARTQAGKFIEHKIKPNKMDPYILDSIKEYGMGTFIDPKTDQVRFILDGFEKFYEKRLKAEKGKK